MAHIRRRSAVACSAACLFILGCINILFNRNERMPATFHVATLDVSHLEKHNLSPTFSYSSRSIKTKVFKGDRPSLSIVNEPLYGTPEVVATQNLSVSITLLPPMVLSIPDDGTKLPNNIHSASIRKDSSIISFGITTPVERLKEAIPQLSHWLSRSKSTLHVLAPPHPEASEVQRTMQDLNINATITDCSLPFAQAYFTLIKHLYDNRTPHTKWFALMDDDTFVPSLRALTTYLTKNYDASTGKVVGAISDDMHQIEQWGLIPYGGGGIYISKPLAAHLSSPKVYDSCIKSELTNGDGILSECMNQWTPVKTTYDPAFNQMDLWGDPSGLFESGRRMLTLHHWKSWFNVDVPAIAKVSAACGDEGILMRFKFPDDMVLTNGYSIVKYPQGVAAVDFDGVEKTWDGEKERFLHKISPLRDPLDSKEKISYRMVETTLLEGGAVRQTYVHRDPIEDRTHARDQVIELIWLKG